MTLVFKVAVVLAICAAVAANASLFRRTLVTGNGQHVDMDIDTFSRYPPPIDTSRRGDMMRSFSSPRERQQEGLSTKVLRHSASSRAHRYQNGGMEEGIDADSISPAETPLYSNGYSGQPPRPTLTVFPDMRAKLAEEAMPVLPSTWQDTPTTPRRSPSPSPLSPTSRRRTSPRPMTVDHGDLAMMQ